MFPYLSSSPEETLGLGHKLAAYLTGDEIIALEGDLGTGKTVLAKGIIKGLGIEDPVTSPTFTIIHEFPHLFPIYHMDLFRIHEGEELLEVGFTHYLYGEGIKIIEWPEVAYGLFPKEHLIISIQWSREDQRLLTFKPFGARYGELVKELKECVGFSR